MAEVARISLRWKEFNKTVSASFDALRKDRELFDVTLVSEDEVHISAHKLVLSACSGFFKDLIKKVNHPNPLLYLGGIESRYLNHILDYLYLGEVNVLQEDVEDFLKCSSRLKINGLQVNEVVKKERVDRSDNVEDKQPQPIGSENSDLYDDHEDFGNDNIDDEDEMYNYAMNLDIEEILKAGDSDDDDETIKEMNTFTEENKVMEENEHPKEESEQKNVWDKVKVSTYEELRQTVKSMMIKKDGASACIRCDKTLSSYSACYDHIERFHTEGLSFDCDQCDKSYPNIRGLNSHKHQKHNVKLIGQVQKEEEKENYDSIGMDLDIDDILGLNEDRKNRASPRGNQEEVAKSLDKKVKVSSETELNEAIKSLILKKDGLHKCKSCNYASTNSVSCAKHIESYHTKGMSYTCDDCQIVCKTRDSLYQHKRRKCTDGDRKTQRSKIMVSSMEDVDREIKSLMTQKEQGKWACTFCDYAGGQAQVRHHADSHLQGVKYECPICGKEFSTRLSRSAHKSRYHNSDVLKPKN